MAHTPANSSIRITPEIEEALKTASFEEIKSIMSRASVEQGLVTPDRFDPNVLIPTEQATVPHPHRFAKNVTVDGVKHVIEGDSELDLTRKETEFYRQQMQQPTATRTEVTRDEQGRFTSPADQGRTDENVFAKAELELKFKRGEVSTSDYLEQSGAMEQYLAKQGIPLEELRASVEEKQGERMVQSWQEATQAFLNSPEGRSWPGGQENLKKVGEIIEQQGWQDEADKVSVLTAAYRQMRENNLVASNPEIEMEKRIREARSPAEVRAAVSSLSGSSSLFSR
jgi:hypothetical protein